MSRGRQPSSSNPPNTTCIDEPIWLYISYIVQPKPKFVTDGSVTITILNNPKLRQQIQVTSSSAASITALKECSRKLGPIICRVQPLPAAGAACFEDLIKDRYSELWRNKVFIRVIGDGQFAEFIGKQLDVDRLISELTKQRPGQSLPLTSPSSVTFDPSGRGVQVIGEFQTHRIPFVITVALGNILDSSCDVIVCPSNYTIDNRHGVAKVIMDAAGHAVREECRHEFNSHGHLKESEVVHTSAGQLYPKSIKNILHAHGPQAVPAKNAYSDELLKKTFFNCFTSATSLGALSIALPALGAGLGGYTPQQVAHAVARALSEFEDVSARKPSQVRLKIVKLFDIDQKVVFALRDVFQANFVTKRTGASGTPDDYQSTRMLPSIDDQMTNMNVAATLTVCVICLNPIQSKSSKKLDCGHEFHEQCINEQIKYQPKCPCCGKIFGKLKGEILRGQRMEPENLKGNLSGYNDCGTLRIKYMIPDGHLQDGRRYKGTRRTAYLPDNAEGRDIAVLLRRAFDDGLVFTVGTSTTSGREGVVTWNDIHHKTELQGPYGYPDPTYLKRVREELAAKGYTSTFDVRPTGVAHRSAMSSLTTTMGVAAAAVSSTIPVTSSLTTTMRTAAASVSCTIPAATQNSYSTMTSPSSTSRTSTSASLTMTSPSSTLRTSTSASTSVTKSSLTTKSSNINGTLTKM